MGAWPIATAICCADFMGGGVNFLLARLSPCLLEEVPVCEMEQGLNFVTVVIQEKVEPHPPKCRYVYISNIIPTIIFFNYQFLYVCFMSFFSQMQDK